MMLYSVIVHGELEVSCSGDRTVAMAPDIKVIDVDNKVQISCGAQ